MSHMTATIAQKNFATILESVIRQDSCTNNVNSCKINQYVKLPSGMVCTRSLLALHCFKQKRHLVRCLDDSSES